MTIQTAQSELHPKFDINTKLTFELDPSTVQSEDIQGRNLCTKPFQMNILLPYGCNQPCAPSDRSPCCNALLNPARDLSNTLRSCLEFLSTTGLQITLRVLVMFWIKAWAYWCTCLCQHPFSSQRGGLAEGTISILRTDDNPTTVGCMIIS